MLLLLELLVRGRRRNEGVAECVPSAGGSAEGGADVEVVTGWDCEEAVRAVAVDGIDVEREGVWMCTMDSLGLFAIEAIVLSEGFRSVVGDDD
jgi:hypothetical protein